MSALEKMRGANQGKLPEKKEAVTGGLSAMRQANSDRVLGTYKNYQIDSHNSQVRAFQESYQRTVTRTGLWDKDESLFKKVTSPVRSAWGGAKESWQNRSEKDFKGAFLEGQAVKTGGEMMAETLEDSSKRIQEMMEAYTNPNLEAGSKQVLYDAFKGTVSGGMGLVNAAFTPITAPLHGASEIPVLGYLADAINAGFAGIGAPFGDAAVEIVEKIPMSEEKKVEMMELADEVGNLIGMIVGGKVIHTQVKKSEIVPKLKEKVDTFSKKLVEESRRINYKRKGYEPYTEETALETIDWGDSAIPKRLHEQANFKDISFDGKRIEPVKTDSTKTDSVNEQARAGEIPVSTETGKQTESSKQSETAPQKEVVGGPEFMQPVGGGKSAPSRVAERIESNLSDGMKNEFGKIPLLEGTNWDFQSRQVLNHINKDPVSAWNVAMGRENAPTGILEIGFWKEMKLRAEAAGDVTAMKELASSPITGFIKRMGQEIGFLFDVDKGSAVGIMQEVISTRRANWEKKHKGMDPEIEVAEVARQIRAEIKKGTSSQKSWEKVLKDLTCK